MKKEETGDKKRPLRKRNHLLLNSMVAVVGGELDWEIFLGIILEVDSAGFGDLFDVHVWREVALEMFYLLASLLI